jgi:hypothetical protein
MKRGSFPTGAGGRDSAKPDAPSEKKLGGALLDFIYLSEEAMRSPECYLAPSSLIEFRRLEIAERIKQLTALFAAQADTVRVVNTEISLTDCLGGLNAISTRADKALDDFAIGPDAGKKPFVHLKTILWDEDLVQFRPDAVTLKNEWADIKSLRKKGHEKILVAYQFAISGWREGYFKSWRRQTAYSRIYSLRPIYWPDLSQEGWVNSVKAISEGTQELWTWLEPRIDSL